MLYRERPCRVCGGRLDTILGLGDLRLSTFPTPGDGPPGLAVAPLVLCQCRSCQLVQLRHTVDPEALFRQYWYHSGINETMRAELRNVVEHAIALRPSLGDGDVVMDVGANDGTLLAAYRAIGCRPYRVAVEPARNFFEALLPHAEEVWADFFPDPRLTARYVGQVQILTSIACFYDLDNPGAFVDAVARLLAPDGIWIVQFQDLHQMLQATAFDNICHEHLVYYSLGSIERLVAQHGLRVVHAEQRQINGGSLRLIIRRNTNGPRDETVAQLRKIEEGCEHWQTLDHFAWQTGLVQSQIRGAIHAEHARGRIIDLYGASTKGNTLLQVCGLGAGQIRQAWERTEAKWGRETITGIPIVSEDEGRAHPPDLLLAAIWQFRTHILQREYEYLAGGGRILFPLPVVDVVQFGKTEVWL